MLNCDVKSLFTNAPSDFTIHLILERVLYKNKEIDTMITEHE